ncbi:hypothetical protein MBUL_01466 [Methylobacterium bullatum]|uniref:Uncharacterized protein n=1 Tax=Methylobacterium bullatum TaxID=570505 RepID=A0A679IXW5_9HYPH|nr:hypothetical protein MBUL_01466 [Methylobacterium bullatum]
MIIDSAYVNPADQLANFWPQLQQGDIVDNIPFTLADLSKLGLVSDQKTSGVDVSLSAIPAEAQLIAAQFEILPGIIVSQTCDLERCDRPIMIAPLRAYSYLYKTKTIGSKAFFDHIKQLANPGKFPVGFPMPPLVSLNFSLDYTIADLHMITTLAPASRNALIYRRKARLGPDLLSLFQERVANFFGRVAAPEGIYFSENHIREQFAV